MSVKYLLLNPNCVIKYISSTSRIQISKILEAEVINAKLL